MTHQPLPRRSCCPCSALPLRTSFRSLTGAYTALTTLLPLALDVSPGIVIPDDARVMARVAGVTATGDRAHGNHLTGDHASVVAAPCYLTTNAKDCSGTSEVDPYVRRRLETDHQPQPARFERGIT